MFFSRLFLSFSKVSKSRDKVLSEGNRVWQITLLHQFFSVVLLQICRVLGSTWICVLGNRILALGGGSIAYSASAWRKLLGKAHLNEWQTWTCRWRCKLQKSPKISPRGCQRRQSGTQRKSCQWKYWRFFSCLHTDSEFPVLPNVVIPFHLFSIVLTRYPISLILQPPGSLFRIIVPSQ